MKHIWIVALILFGSSLQAGEVIAPPADEVERLSLDPFYKKYLSYKGFPIVSSEKVSDFALKEAAYLIDKMLGEREDIVVAMVESKVRLAIMAPDEFTTQIPEHSDLEPKAYWDKRARGLGATQQRPAVSVGEENLLGYPGDPYSRESIMVHEFAHAFHQMGLNVIDPEFQSRLENAYNRAKLKGLWRGKYAGTNPSEYWAEAVQSWFDTNRENDHDHNHVDTRTELKVYDPGVAELIESVLGNSEWRYEHPGERMTEPHLAGFDPKKATLFSWPKALVDAYAAIERGEGRVVVPLQSMASLPRNSVTKESGKTISMRFQNGSADRLGIYWIGFDGLRRHYRDLDPGRSYDQSTYGSHLWVFVNEDGKEIGWIAAPESDGMVEVK